MKYKTHDQLGISFAEYGALLGTRAMLANGVLIDRCALADLTSKQSANAHVFDMNMPLKCEGCGSVGCIGGHMALIMNLPAPAIDAYVLGRSYYPDPRSPCEMAPMPIVCSRSLRKLFYPDGITKEWEDVTPYEAVEAIDNFLSTGNPRWTEVCDGAGDEP